MITYDIEIIWLNLYAKIFKTGEDLKKNVLKFCCLPQICQKLVALEFKPFLVKLRELGNCLYLVANGMNCHF